MYINLKYGLALVLIFVGTNMLIMGWFKIPVGIAPSVVAAIIATPVILSLAVRKETQRTLSLVAARHPPFESASPRKGVALSPPGSGGWLTPTPPDEIKPLQKGRHGPGHARAITKNGDSPEAKAQNKQLFKKRAIHYVPYVLPRAGDPRPDSRPGRLRRQPGATPGRPPQVLEANRPAFLPPAPAGAAPIAELPAADRARIQKSFGQLPLSFIENQGQAGERIAYYTQSPGRSIYFTPDGHALRLTQGKGEDAKAHTIKVELLDAAPERLESLQPAQGIVSYFKGPKENWQTAIPTHSKIGYVQPWPGVDLAYDGANGKLESIYTVAPHADPGQIKLRYSGQESLTLDDDGNLVYTTSLGEIKETAPIAWQDIDGHRLPVETHFTLLDDSTVAFQIAEYDPDHALIIDPTLVYASYIGGSGEDYGTGIAVDSAGNAYVTGYTASTEATFPVTVGPDLTYNGGSYDAFVAKVNAAGALVYCGYIGGSGEDVGRGIAVDSVGNAHVTGYTTSTAASFPVTVGPDLTANGAYDAFVAKIGDVGDADPTPGPQVTILINGQPAGGDVVIMGAREAQARSHTPVKVDYTLSESSGLELFVVVQAPALGIHWSYLDAAGKFIPLPAEYYKITPYKPKGLAPGTYTLYNGPLPAGVYELYIAVDFIANGHLDYRYALNGGRYAYARVRVF